MVNPDREEVKVDLVKVLLSQLNPVGWAVELY
jgi:hypothetical protein